MNIARLLASLSAAILLAPHISAAPLYENDFQNAAPDKLPEEFMVIAGTFEMKSENGNAFLELPGAPLDTFGLLFGPTQQSGLNASARFLGTKQGRRFPTFAISLNGIAGYRLQMSPAKKALELFKGDEPKATIPYDWQSGKWTTLRLRLRTVGGKQVVEGKAWHEQAAEPGKWLINFTDTEEVPPGRAGIWGSPYSGTPIRFDDLSVTKATAD